MQIVIDIDVRAYNKCLKLANDDDDMRFVGLHLINAVANGTPLPKGHGRLIDADALKKLYDERISRLYELNKKDNPSRESKICATNWCNNTVEELPTIIEADKAESEE